ncbi:MAG: hypothetical protein ACO3A8_09000 [Steroidobacteraceae bacterium]|jgi:hypothetical protein
MLRPPCSATLRCVTATAVAIVGSAYADCADWQLSSVRVNGISLELRSAVLPVARERATRELLSAWSGQGLARPTIVELDDRTVIGRQHGTVHQTVTLRDAENAAAVRVEFAAQDLARRAAPVPKPPFDLPPGARVLQVVEFLDASRNARQYAIHLRRASTVAMASLRTALQASGWSSTARAVAEVSGDHGYVVHAQRGAERMEATLQAADGGTRLILLVSGHAQ